VRFVGRDGRWRVDPIQLELTGRDRDGEWLRVTGTAYKREMRATGMEERHRPDV
jgi:hypothetical protein